MERLLKENESLRASLAMAKEELAARDVMAKTKKERNTKAKYLKGVVRITQDSTYEIVRSFDEKALAAKKSKKEGKMRAISPPAPESDDLESDLEARAIFALSHLRCELFYIHVKVLISRYD